MIQRIQSLFILIAILCMTSLFFFPFAGYAGRAYYSLDFRGLHTLATGMEVNSGNHIILLTGGILILLFLFITVLQFKHRKRQMNLCMLLMFMLIAQQTLMYITADQFKDQLATEISFKTGFIFPLVSLVLVVLAFINIRKDERLVKSLDRLR